MRVHTKELRSHPRYALQGSVAISWQDGHGRFRTSQSKGIDICVSGLQIEATDPIDLHTNVMVRSERLQLSASTAVRYCRQHGPRYRIGLEFTGGLHWRPPGDKP
ncbi:MAG: PilZ domain-containing protein [Bryobacterales bacterium]|nr:PilZ domain-containing protein [Bryobacterales bacterium]